MTVFISATIAIIIPLLFLYLIYALEIYAQSRPRTLIFGLCLGAAAFFIAFVVHTALLRFELISFFALIWVVAPVFEELLKAAFLIALIRRTEVRYVVDGVSYGFAVGIGFAVTENLLHITTGLEVSLARVLSVNLMHAFTGALFGAVLGGLYYHTQRVRYTRIGLALVVMVLVHALFNLVAAAFSGYVLIITAILIGFSCLGAIIALVYFALKRERQLISGQLGTEVSAAEREAAIDPQLFAQILNAHRDELGDGRLKLIEQYIALHTQLGIIRKTQTLNQRPEYQRLLQEKEAELQQRISGLRAEIGLYTWIWLRTVIPSPETASWKNLEKELGRSNPFLELAIKLGERQQSLMRAEIDRRIRLLRRVKLFEPLSPSDLEDLAVMMTSQHHEIGDVVLQRGDISANLFCVAAGQLVASAIDEKGNETIVSGLARGAVFGELSMIDLEPHPFTVSCVAAVELLVLAREDLLTLINGKPQVGIAMMRELVAQLRQQTQLLMWVRQTSEHDTYADLIDGRVFTRASS